MASQDQNQSCSTEPGTEDLPRLVSYLRGRLNRAEAALETSRDELESLHARVSKLRDFTRAQDEKMDDVANDGRDAVPPTGDDWNDLFGAVQECVGGLTAPPTTVTPAHTLPMSDAAYVRLKGVRCPFCKAGGVTGHSWNVEEGTATQEITCDVCDEEWFDVYNLVGFQSDVRVEDDELEEER